MNKLNALYAIKQNSVVDNTIRYDLLELGVNLEYANSAYDLMTKVQLNQPILLIIDGDKYEISDDFLSLFSIKSTYFVPCVIIVHNKELLLPKQDYNNILYFQKNFSISNIKNLIIDLINKHNLYKNQLNNVLNREEVISSILIKLGITQKSIGFSYLRDCTMELINLDCCALNFDSCLYEPISKKHNKTHTALERSMRYAINKAWENGTLSQFRYYDRQIFQTKPSIKEVVYAIGSSIRSYEIDLKLKELPNINSLLSNKA